QRSREQKALEKIAAQFPEQLLMFRGLDALHRHAKAARLRERNDAAEQLPPLFVSRQEASVDLHDIAQQTLKILEIRVSRAEIVQPPLHADAAKRTQPAGDLVRLLDDRAFRELEDKPRRRKPALAEDARDGVDQRRVTQVQRRQVDADLKSAVP